MKKSLTHKNLVLTNYLEIRILELEKVKRAYLKNKQNEKIQWMLFLDDPNSKEAKEIMEENKDIKEAVVEVRKMSEDDKLRRLADLREKAIMDEKAIYAGGVEKGIKQGKIQMIKKLYEADMPMKEIAKVAEMTEEEVKRIIESK